LWGYRESEPLGGYDPYSNSKACSELVTSSYRSSFFNPKDYKVHGVAVATARAGNVIGGGDWAVDRLIPDCVRAALTGEKVLIRNPHAVRPWQYVLEPLAGYLVLAERLCGEGAGYAEGWNFGPDDSDARPVDWIVKMFCDKWGAGLGYVLDGGDHPHEAGYLKLDCSKAKARLKWHPVWHLEEAIYRVIEWTNAYAENRPLAEVCKRQIADYCNDAAKTIRE
jgi:CDP-glucose 4,6-dehydratase